MVFSERISDIYLTRKVNYHTNVPHIIEIDTNSYATRNILHRRFIRQWVRTRIAVATLVNMAVHIFWGLTNSTQRKGSSTITIFVSLFRYKIWWISKVATRDQQIQLALNWLSFANRWIQFVVLWTALKKKDTKWWLSLVFCTMLLLLFSNTETQPDEVRWNAHRTSQGSLVISSL